jgi:hypothetical protein
MLHDIDNVEGGIDMTQEFGLPEGTDPRTYFNEKYMNALEKLAGEVLDKIFEISGREMSPPESQKIIQEWRDEGDEGFEGMIEHIERAILDVAFDINQIVQEELDYNYPEGEEKTGNEVTRINS